MAAHIINAPRRAVVNGHFKVIKEHQVKYMYILRAKLTRNVWLEFQPHRSTICQLWTIYLMLSQSLHGEEVAPINEAGVSELCVVNFSIYRIHIQ